MASEISAPLSDCRLRRASDALAAQVDGELVMLVLSTGMYHSLSGVAARIWELLETPATPDQVAERIASEYAVSLAQCRDDTLAFFGQLLEAGLIEAA